MSESKNPLLRVQGLSKRFGGLKAVNEVSFDLQQGEILGLLGPNGAGKTTAFNLIAGFHRADQGRILFEGADVLGMAPSDICRAGIARTFQLSRPFGGLSAVENVMVGAFARLKSTTKSRDLAMELLDFLNMSDRCTADANDLTAFDKRKIELGRALATQPRLLLMDEVVAGATPSEAAEMVALVRRVRDRGITVLIVEHVMKVIMGLSDRVIVMDQGCLIANGEPQTVVKDPRVLTAYFGEGYVGTDV
ncbi:ABC transporter ATP-binding protein [Hydrogenophaga sp. Root209]|uniref:ABC transporter ATP-binding protein n=1 Tax=unclassified Hydrogenophaga TaxID=2610897 RepID=UPI0006F7213A|nr:ABC transporter ATP-binding protein [Hydrogenophaga sp. Root209]KRC12380.1 ABC transporter ATP-binding protein [Hydrogenophaga sp. Root209]